MLLGGPPPFPLSPHPWPFLPARCHCHTAICYRHKLLVAREPKVCKLPEA